MNKDLLLFALLLPATLPAAEFRSAFVEGAGDPVILEAINATYESTQPSAKMACLPLLYKRDWDGFVEGLTWPWMCFTSAPLAGWPADWWIASPAARSGN